MRLRFIHILPEGPYITFRISVHCLKSNTLFFKIDSMVKAVHHRIEISFFIVLVDVFFHLSPRNILDYEHYVFVEFQIRQLCHRVRLCG